MHYSKERAIAVETVRYPHRRAFFELVRFDFVLDSGLNVHLMEANMSPNLGSRHLPPNGLMFEQVLYSLLRLVGVFSPSSEDEAGEAEMQVLVFRRLKQGCQVIQTSASS